MGHKNCEQKFCEQKFCEQTGVSYPGRKTHPQKPPTPIKRVYVSSFRDCSCKTVLPLSFELNKRYAERVWANCLPKLFSIGFVGVVFFGGGFFSLDL